jgi:hypothetical protein
MSTDGMTFDLGTVTLAPDADTHKDFDVRAVFPGSISVRERVNGDPASSVIVWVDDSTNGTLAGVILLDSQGAGKSGLILPGTYALFSSPVDSSWIHVASGERTLKAGESLVIDLDVQLVQGVLHVLDRESGTPSANENVSFALDDGRQSPRSAQARTDEQGNVKLALPPARYRVEAGLMTGFFSPESSVVVDWTSTGPIPPEVRLKPSEFPR